MSHLLHDYSNVHVRTGDTIDYKGVLYRVVKIADSHAQVRTLDNTVTLTLSPAQIALSDRINSD